MTEQEKFSDTVMNIAVGYLMNGCEGCPFYGIEEYEIRQICDSKPINCVWWWMNRYFNQVEQEEDKENKDG